MLLAVDSVEDPDASLLLGSNFVYIRTRRRNGDNQVALSYGPRLELLALLERKGLERILKKSLETILKKKTWE